MSKRIEVYTTQVHHIIVRQRRNNTTTTEIALDLRLRIYTYHTRIV